MSLGIHLHNNVNRNTDKSTMVSTNLHRNMKTFPQSTRLQPDRNLDTDTSAPFDYIWCVPLCFTTLGGFRRAATLCLRPRRIFTHCEFPPVVPSLPSTAWVLWAAFWFFLNSIPSQCHVPTARGVVRRKMGEGVGVWEHSVRGTRRPGGPSHVSTGDLTISGTNQRPIIEWHPWKQGRCLFTVQPLFTSSLPHAVTRAGRL